MGEPTFLSVLLWIGAAVLIGFVAVAISPLGKDFPQRGQGIFGLTVVGLILIGLGFLTSNPAQPTSVEVASAARMAAAHHRNDLISRLAGFPTEARETTDRLASMNADAVSDMDGALDAVRLFRDAGLSIMIVERAATSGEAPVSIEVIAAKDQLKFALVKRQRALFPEIRKTYAAYMSDAVSGAPANFRAVGPSGKTLRGASPSFRSRDVVSEAHHTIMGQATQFRFTKAEYVYSLTGASYAMPVSGVDDATVGG